MSDGSGYPPRKITKLTKYEYQEIIIEAGQIYEDLVAVCEIQKVEWTTRIKPVKKCVHVVKYIDLTTGGERELNVEIFWRYFVRKA